MQLILLIDGKERRKMYLSMTDDPSLSWQERVTRRQQRVNKEAMYLRTLYYLEIENSSHWEIRLEAKSRK